MNKMRDEVKINDTMQVRPRYSLVRAMLIVRQVETLASRKAVFEEIKSKNRIIRWVDGIYAFGGTFLVRRVMLFLYMVKCTAALRETGGPKTRAIAMANFANEVHTIERVTALLPEYEIALMRPSIRNALRLAQVLAMGRMIGTLPRIWPILGVMARRHSFMPACRISSALAYYIRFGEVLQNRPPDTTAIVASNYSPESVGFAAAAHCHNRKVVYINHAPVPRNALYVPPVLADLSVFHGAFVKETYETRSICITQAVYIGQSGKALAMTFPQTLSCVGIFLTALTRKDTILRLIAEIRAVYPDVDILIRHHPVALLETDLSSLSSDDRIQVTIGAPLEGDIAACDVIICGNSGVVLNALRGGRPVAYVPELDEILFDYNGFCEKQLVPRIAKWDADTLEALNAFYSVPMWSSVMVGYDASYGKSAQVLDKEVRDSLISVLGPRS